MAEDQNNARSNYACVYTALNASLVSNSAIGSFLGAGETNLIVAKDSHLEVFSVEEDQLHLLCEVPTYLRVRKLVAIKTMFPIDLLFLVLDMYFVVASFDFETKELRPLYSETILPREVTDRSDLIFTPYLPADLASKRFVLSFSVDGVFTHMHFETDLTFTEGHGLNGSVSAKTNDFAMDAGCDLVDVIFMGDYSVGFLIRDAETRAVFVKTYDIEPDQFTFLPGTISGTTNDNTTSVFAPIPIQGGIITIGAKEINYFKPTGKKMISFPNVDLSEDDSDRFRIVQECIAIDNNMFYYCDVGGRWYIVLVERDKVGEVLKLQRIELGTHGEITCCSKLLQVQRDHTYMAFVMFMGMLKTDSQLVTIIPTNPPEQRVEIESKYNSFYATNVALNASNPQNTTIVGCSDRNNYLSILKNGASITEYAWFEQTHVKSIWALKQSSKDEFHSLLVFSFVGQTRILRAGKDVTETSIAAIKPDIETLFIGNVDHDQIVHVTTAGITLLNNKFKVVSEWKVPSGRISAAVASTTQVTIAQGNVVQTFNIGKHGVAPLASAKQSDDVAFLIYEFDENRVARTLFVALWRSNSIHCLSLPYLEKLCSVALSEPDPVIRCLAIHESDLMVGLGDGRILYYVYDSHLHTLQKVQSFQIADPHSCLRPNDSNLILYAKGTTQVRCESIELDDSSFFFVCTDRPSLIVSDKFGHRVLPVNTNLPIWFVCPFKFEYLDGWAIVGSNDDHVKIFSLDNVEKLHATKFDLKEFTPTDIDHFSTQNLYATICAKNGGAYIRLVDIDQPLDHAQNQYSFMIDVDAEPLCISHLKLKHPNTKKTSDFLGAVTFSDESSTLSLYQIQKNSAGIYVVSEFQSVQFEVMLVNFNTNGDLDFAAERDGLFFHNIATDPSCDLVVPLSLSTELNFYSIKEENHQIEFRQLEIGRSVGYKCADFPLRVAFMNGEKKQLVAGTMQGRIQFFLDQPSTKRSSRNKFIYNLSDTVCSMSSTKDGNVIYTTQSGAVGVCKLISKEDFDVLSVLQTKLSETVPMLVPISHEELRFNYSAVEDEEYSQGAFVATNLIDGDFITKFLTLGKYVREQIEEEMHMNVTEFIQQFHQGLLFS